MEEGLNLSKSKYKNIKIINEKTQTFFEKKISNFYKERSEIYKKPLEKIIKRMLDQCKYMNGESLERHNWGTEPQKIKYLPTNKDKSDSLEQIIMEAIEKNKNENIDCSNIELLWGDIQLGKRIHACIIMWFSVFILQRPVLYIFRNLDIDQKQLQDDILGTDEYNFNSQYIKKIFNVFNDEIRIFF